MWPGLMASAETKRQALGGKAEESEGRREVMCTFSAMRLKLLYSGLFSRGVYFANFAK